MKYIKWKIMSTTCFVCLLPILLGLSLWEKLPDMVAIHFDLNGKPDNFASKGFVVFAIPVLMAFLQIFCCVISDINAKKHGESNKFERVSKWIIPVTCVVLYIATLGYGLDWNIDIRRIAVLLVGGIFLVLGNYLPKLDYIKNYNIDREKAKKINRFWGFGTVGMGILAIVTIFLPPTASAVWLILLIPYAVTGIWYGIRHGKKKAEE